MRMLYSVDSKKHVHLNYGIHLFERKDLMIHRGKTEDVI